MPTKPQLSRQTLQSLRRSLTSESMMIHGPVLGQWLETFETALTEDWHDPKQLRSALGVNAAAERMTITRSGVAVISITGMIRHKNDIWVRWGFGTSNLQVAADVLEAIANPKVRAVVLDVDSPGGLSMGNEEASRQIYDARGTKPIVSSINGFGASAAYYLAAAADKVFASASSVTPSVGTILMHVDVSQYYGEMGVKFTSIHHGENKGTGSPYQPLSDKSRKLMQEFVDGHGEQFVAAVARYRGISVAEVKEKFGQGWIFATAQQALERGVIDGIANRGDVIESLSGESDEGTASTDKFEEAIRAFENCGFGSGSGESSGTTSFEITAAAAPPVTSQSAAKPAPPSSSTQEQPIVNKRIKAALYALGYVESQDASDDVCNAALNAFYLASRRTRSQDDQQILKDLSAAAAGPTEESNQSQSQGQGQGQKLPETAPAKRDEVTAAQDKERRDDIRATGAKFRIDQNLIDAAIDEGISHAAFAKQVLDTLSTNEPAIDSTYIGAGEAQADKLEACFTAVMCERFAIETNDEKKPEGFYQYASASVMQFVRADMAQRGIANRFGNDEEMAKAYLKLESHDFEIVGFGESHAMEGSAQRSGDFPNLLSALANKVMNVGINLAMPTYQEYSWRMPNVPDYNPRTIHDIGGFDELDLIFEDDDPKQLKLSEEVAWIKADSFANKWGLTQRMIVQGDMSKWMRGLQGLGTAAENTVNRLNLYLVVGNADAHDGVALFHADHGNDVTDGGAPSATQSTAMKAKFRQQTGIGGKGFLREPPAIALVPSNHEDAADSTFLTIARLAESKVANTDSNINVHRGRIKPVVEPELDGFSTDVWYMFANPQRRPVIAHAFLTGYGPGGRRRSYVDPATGTRFYVMEQHVGAAVVGYRGAVRNDGTAE